ncbi:regulatory protein RecX [Candidatus Gottesmanbacteria bacterium]|nr:regulatory protein RecX [Candidatus Gottesmanbacteria bacterium]
MEDENYQKLRDYALKLLSFRPRSSREISTKLRQFSAKRNFSDKLVEQIIEELREQKFLDDKEFVRWWIEQRQSFRPKGLRAIKTELLNKGIDKEIIDAVFAADKGKMNEYDLALKVINKKLIHLSHLSTEKKKIKIRDLLLRRGFDWDVIYKVIDSTFEKA